KPPADPGTPVPGHRRPNLDRAVPSGSRSVSVKRTRAILLILATIAAMGALAAPSGAAGSQPTPRWVLHTQRYPGSISNGVRAMVSPAAVAAQARRLRASGAVAAPALQNVQMNDDSNPPLPQNETAVAYNTRNPLIAVAASNDYVGGGGAIMRTTNGGQSWRTTRVTPQFRGTGDFCTGGDPAVAYSHRDRAFYISQLCFFRALPFSEVHVIKSVDNGQTWTPGRQAARAASNFDYTTGTVDETIFNDKEYIAVDNTPTSPHYGRLYVTYTKFHIAADGSSDYCPIQLASTDTIPTANPSLTVFGHTPVVPDAPGAGGVGESANQFSVPRSNATEPWTSATPSRNATPHWTTASASRSQPTAEPASCPPRCRSTSRASSSTTPTPATCCPRPCSGPPTPCRSTTATGPAR